MTPTEAIAALEKALEAVFLPAKEENALAQAMHERDARRYFNDAANPLAIRTLLDAHAGALRDAERYRTLKHAPTELIQDLIIAAPGRWDDIADAARAALATNTKGTAE